MFDPTAERYDKKIKNIVVKTVQSSIHRSVQLAGLEDMTCYGEG